MIKFFIAVLHHNNINNINTFLKNYFANVDSSVAELFILDNGSSETIYNDIVSIHSNYNNWNLLRSEENTGVIGGRNLLFDVFSDRIQDYSGILFLDDDQFITSPKFLSLYTKRINNGFDVLGYEAWQMNKNLLPKIKVKNYGDRFTYVGCGGMYISSAVFKSVGKFDEIFNPCYFEDPDYNFRCIENGYKIDWIPNLPVIHKAHSTLSKRGDRKSRFRNSWSEFKKKWNGRVPEKTYLI